MVIESLQLFHDSITNSVFNTTFICSSAETAAKTIELPSSFNFAEHIAFNVLFVNGHNCGSATYNLKLNGKPVKVNSNGTYQNLPVFQVGTGASAKYWSIQPGMAIQLYYDATQDAFIVVGNPVVISLTDDKVLADGSKLWDFMKGKISSVLGLTASNYGGKAATAGTADSATSAGSATTAGKCTGNAATATKWETARNFSVKDSSGNHTGTAQSVNGTGNVSLPLPGTLDVDITGTAYKIRVGAPAAAQQVNGAIWIE